jgi:hypothetical protein
LVVLRAFLRGVLEIRLFFGGNLLVDLWWLCGGLWCEDDAYLSAENFPLFLTLFLAGQFDGIVSPRNSMGELTVTAKMTH